MKLRTYLDLVFRKLLCERSPPCTQWVDGIVDCYLTILVVEKVIDVFPAFSQDLLAEEHGGGACLRQDNRSADKPGHVKDDTFLQCCNG